MGTKVRLVLAAVAALGACTPFAEGPEETSSEQNSSGGGGRVDSTAGEATESAASSWKTGGAGARDAGAHAADGTFVCSESLGVRCKRGTEACHRHMLGADCKPMPADGTCDALCVLGKARCTGEPEQGMIVTCALDD